MFPYNQHTYGRNPMQMPPGVQYPPGFNFPPGVVPAPGSASSAFVAPGVGVSGVIAGGPQAGLPSRPGVPAFPPPAGLPNINFNAPIIRLGTSTSKSQSQSGGTAPQSTPAHSSTSKASTREGGLLSRESASSFIAPTPEEQIKSVFVASLPPNFEDDWVEQILKAAGPLKRWVRVQDEHGKPCNFGFCEYESLESVFTATSVIHGLSIPRADKPEDVARISITRDERSEGLIEKFKPLSADKNEDDLGDSSSNKDSVREIIDKVLTEYTDPKRLLGTKPGDTDRNVEQEGEDQPQPEVVTISLSIDDELADIPADMRETVSKEIAAFRERSNKRDIERIKREEEIEQQERERASGSRSTKYSSPPILAPTGPSGGSNNVPIGPSRLRNDIPLSAPTGPAAQTIRFINGSSNNSKLIQEDDNSDASDHELEIRREKKKARDADAIFLDHERRWLNRERSRTSAIERETARDKEDLRREEMERGAMGLRLSEWDDDVELERRVEDYYIDRSLWIRNRAQFRSREKDLDMRDKNLEERALDHEKKATELTPEDSRRKSGQGDGQPATSQETILQPRIKLSLGASLRNKATDGIKPRRTIAEIEGLLEDEEEDVAKSRRVLVPIQYEDTTAVDDESREELVKALAQEIPSDRHGLWEWSVNWDFVDDAMIKDKLQPFIEKKIVEYLGVQEQELINFVLDHVKKRGSAADLVKELEMALDEDAEVLVKKIWRMLIFFSEGEKRGLVT